MADDGAEGLFGVESRSHDDLPLTDDMRWLQDRIARFVAGGTYLVAGEPGIGKSTIGIQLALDLGRQGIRSLLVLTEQTTEDIADRARLMTSTWPQAEADAALSKVATEDGLDDIETLPQLLQYQVMNHGGRHRDVKLIVVDSVQGQGLAAGATRKYRQVFEFCRQCKSAGITVLLVAHVTKRGEIAGPKDLEHHVDCVLVMRKAMAYRPLFVPKNRYGPAVFTPVPLEMDRVTTALRLARHSTSVRTIARTFLGRGSELPEVQAAVALPSYGSRGRITAPGLPRKEIEQLANCISQIPDMDLDDLDYTIHCRLPGGRQYRNELGLPLCMALIASYVQLDVPQHCLYLGEIDLLRQVREINPTLVSELSAAVAQGEVPTPARLFVPPRAAETLRDAGLDGVSVMSCARLDDAVFQTWPELRPSPGA